MFLVVCIANSTTNAITYWNLSRFRCDIASAMSQDGNNSDLLEIGAFTTT